MRKIIFSLLGLAGLALAGLVPSSTVVPAQPAGPANQISCSRSVIASGAVPATTQVVNGVAGQTISLCGWIASSAAATTMSIITGTGTLCGTDSRALTAAHAIPAGTFIAFSGVNAWYSTPIGYNLCIITTGTGTLQATLMYTQF